MGFELKRIAMDNEEEEFLHSLIYLWSIFDRVRLAGDLTRNEMHVCYILYYNKKYRDREPLTPTDISRISQIPKSQINRTLNKLEERGVITRVQSATDHRMVNVHLCTEGVQPFIEQYKQHIRLTNGLKNKLGPEKAHLLQSLLTESIAIIKQDLETSIE